MGSGIAEFDRRTLTAHFDRIVGVDEAGRGCLAGPVVAAAVILPDGAHLPDVDDSKRLTPARRAEQLELIRACALSIGMSFVGPRCIERLDIRKASLLAMRRAVRRAIRLLAARNAGPVGGESLRVDPSRLLVLVDGIDRIEGIGAPQRSVVGGDGLSLSIAAASIVAKTLRDRLMIRLAHDYPAYGFERHKGYGTEEHLAAIARAGPCPWHRMTFSPLARLPLFAP